MARGKKKETMMPEDRLQAALIPESEQPYPVPGNWCWIQLGELYQINPKNLAEDFVDAAFIPMEKIAPGFVNEYSFDVQPWCKAKKGHTQFADGDVAFAKISPCFENRKSMLLNNLPNGIGGGTTELVILRQSHMNQKYTFWFISQEQFIRGGIATYSGTVGQQRISMDYVRTYPIPVPPLPEQQRIVDRIESLFAKLDEAKQKAQDTLDTFEIRKAAILHKAFNGELTAQWRKEHCVGMESRKKKQISQCSTLITKGASPRWQGISYTNDRSQTLFITSENVRQGYLDLRKRKYLDNSINDIQQRSVLSKGDVLVNIVGASIGRAAVFELDCVANINQAVCLIRLKNDLLNTFLCYYLNSPNALMYYDENKVETARANISLKDIREMTIVCPIVEEQMEIVRILDDLLAKEQQAKESAEGVLEQIDLIKKAILTRAFRGELDTNDPSEESAVSLLKEIISTVPKKLDSFSNQHSVKHQIPVEIQMQLTTVIQEKLYCFILENPHCTVEKAISIEKDVLKVAQALRELQSKSLILQNEEDNTLTVVV